MANNWTKEQLKAINCSGKNLLVAAAAGSGKTAVLVERIIKKILVDNIDIDKMLVVTFTNAAAAEMRERILERLYKEVDKNPENKRLQEQITLLNKANISTIHSFCLEVIKNYFYEIDIAPNFRIGDTTEIELIKQEVLEELFEEYYEENNEEFIELVNIYGGYRGDENLKEIILKIYRYIQSTPYPTKWLHDKIEMFNLNIHEDFSKTIWGKIIIDNVKEEIEDCINTLKSIQEELRKEVELDKYLIIVSEDIDILENILKNTKNWDDLNFAMNYEFTKWPIDRKVTSDLKEKAKAVRDNVKSRLKNLKEDYLIGVSYNVNNDLYEEYKILKNLSNIVEEFSYRFQQEKKEKNIVDFNDIEHFALDILVKEENGKELPTEIAKQYQEKFIEIAIDEYQDSNLVQEKILNAISKGNNIFMVGDVKQSIYKFRQARPELFLEKYENYVDIEENESLNKNSKVKLFKNFRSKENILNFTNLIFDNIMSKKLGEIEYNNEEFLNPGNEYIDTKENINRLNNKIELDIINYESIEEDDEEVIEDKISIEANLVAKKIKELIEGKYCICNKDNTFRRIEFKDIVILLRSTKDCAEIYEKAITALNFPVYSDISSSYFESIEIETIMNMLKIIDNPNNDIALVSILRSAIANFTDNELVEVRITNQKKTFYDVLKECQEKTNNNVLKNKINCFLKNLHDFQDKSQYLKLDELIWYIYEKTGYYDYVSVLPNGKIKTANLKMLFEKAKDYEVASFKGLYNFINYIERVKRGSQDRTSAKLIGENENVIRIMSIHKSKGLEFPVVFLCATGKQFNMQDLNQDIILHQDIGLGPKYINYERKIEYNTLAKEAIKIKIKNEILAEEMRLLYVALTRSREKLVIIGTDKNLNKSTEEKRNRLKLIEKDKKIPSFILKKAKSYLDWIENVLEYDKRINEMIDVHVHSRKETEILEEIEVEGKKEIYEEEEKNKKINELLTWSYKNEFLTKVQGKTSVSKITKENNNEELIEVSQEPKIVVENSKLTKAEIGTIMHLILQKLDFSKRYNEKELIALLEELVFKDIITQEEKGTVDIIKLLKFTESSIFSEARKAKEIHKEEPFYINIPVKELYDEDNDEKILVQGIIDLYFVSEDNEIVLVDYKTDYVPNNDLNYLKEKYCKQLVLYKKALEKALNKKVSRTYIYSTYMSEEIKIM